MWSEYHTPGGCCVYLVRRRGARRNSALGVLNLPVEGEKDDHEHAFPVRPTYRRRQVCAHLAATQNIFHGCAVARYPLLHLVQQRHRKHSTDTSSFFSTAAQQAPQARDPALEVRVRLHPSKGEPSPPAPCSACARRGRRRLRPRCDRRAFRKKGVPEQGAVHLPPPRVGRRRR